VPPEVFALPPSNELDPPSTGEPLLPPVVPLELSAEGAFGDPELQAQSVARTPSHLRRFTSVGSMANYVGYYPSRQAPRPCVHHAPEPCRRRRVRRQTTAPEARRGGRTGTWLGREMVPMHGRLNRYNRGNLSIRPLLLSSAVVVPLLGSAVAHAASIEDTVRKHVQSGLSDKPAPKQEPKPAPTQEPKPAPKQEPKPAPIQGPKPAPTQESKPASIQGPKLQTDRSASSAALAQQPTAATAQPQPAAAQPTSAATKVPAPPAAQAKPGEPQSGAALVLQLPGAGDSKEPPGPSIPQRVFGKYFRLDPKIGGGLRGWIPASYPTVKTSADTYYTWSADVSGTFFKYINLHRGYYESNGLAGPRHQGAAVAVQSADYAKKAAWLLGVIGVPITKTWEPIIRYESRAFQTHAIPRQPVRIVPFNTPPETDLATIAPTTSPLTVVSGFETFVVAMRYNQSGEPATVGNKTNAVLPPFYFGVGFTQYSKPYQVTVGESVLDSVLFDARFRGAGLALGANLPSKPDFLILDASVQFGLGEVRLLDKMTLNELLPNTPGRSGLRPPQWVIGYVEGDVSVGYLYTLLRTKPSVLVSAVANGGGARFYAIKTQSEQGEQVNMPSLNWDFLWGLMGYITVPL
jgi:hypothetical protein